MSVATPPYRLVLFNKPYRVLCQFSPSGGKATLADYIRIPGVYPAGRLDYDSEGLVILTDWGRAQHLITDPRGKLAKRYLVQVEGAPDGAALELLRRGVRLADGVTLPAAADRIEPPDVWERTPPIRSRASLPTAWIALTIVEGRNRQVRRMTAAAGHPTLRLIRDAVGPWSLGALAPGEFREAPPSDLRDPFPHL
jgi:23S rRNA pseudouridine2457 synthase